MQARESFRQMSREPLEFRGEGLFSEFDGILEPLTDPGLLRLIHVGVQGHKVVRRLDGRVRNLQIEQAQQTINGIEPQTLRDSNRLRQMVARDFEQIQASVGEMLVDRPRRNILRRGNVGGAA